MQACTYRAQDVIAHMSLRKKRVCLKLMISQPHGLSVRTYHRGQKLQLVAACRVTLLFSEVTTHTRLDDKIHSVAYSRNDVLRLVSTRSTPWTSAQVAVW